MHRGRDAGSYIGHYGGIVVQQGCGDGRNCNISKGLDLGRRSAIDEKLPVIGGRGYLAPGCKAVGGCRVEASAAIGANAIVVCDLAAVTIVAGVPAHSIAGAGSGECIPNPGGRVELAA